MSAAPAEADLKVARAREVNDFGQSHMHNCERELSDMMHGHVEEIGYGLMVQQPPLQQNAVTM